MLGKQSSWESSLATASWSPTSDVFDDGSADHKSTIDDRRQAHLMYCGTPSLPPGTTLSVASRASTGVGVPQLSSTILYTVHGYTKTCICQQVLRAFQSFRPAHRMIPGRKRRADPAWEDHMGAKVPRGPSLLPVFSSGSTSSENLGAAPYHPAPGKPQKPVTYTPEVRHGPHPDSKLCQNYHWVRYPFVASV